MQFDLANVLVFAILGGGFLAATLFLGSLLRPHTPDPEKLGIYECGEKPVQQAWFNFNPRFYIIALIFLIFDVEVAFTYPVAAVFKRWVAYVWRKGDLEWIRRLKHDKGYIQEQQAEKKPVQAEDKKKAAA
jgi:NADH-quinone oxidoreductase subunit A